MLKPVVSLKLDIGIEFILIITHSTIPVIMTFIDRKNGLI